jgi:hypothetical protein
VLKQDIIDANHFEKKLGRDTKKRIAKGKKLAKKLESNFSMNFICVF